MTPLVGLAGGPIAAALGAFAWPLAVVVVAAAFLLLFRKNVAGLIDRMNEVRGPGGFGASAVDQQHAVAEIVDEDGDDPAALYELVAQYATELERVRAEAEESAERLAEQVVFARLELDFERTYGLIFGSQLRALRALRVAGVEGLPRHEIEVHFEAMRAVAEGVGADPWAFEQWMTYLMRATYSGPLVEVAASGNYVITQAGNNFLIYIEMRGYQDRAL